MLIQNLGIKNVKYGRLRKIASPDVQLIDSKFIVSSRFVIHWEK